MQITLSDSPSVMTIETLVDHSYVGILVRGDGAGKYFLCRHHFKEGYCFVNETGVYVYGQETRLEAIEYAAGDVDDDDIVIFHVFKTEAELYLWMSESI